MIYYFNCNYGTKTIDYSVLFIIQHYKHFIEVQRNNEKYVEAYNYAL